MAMFIAPVQIIDGGAVSSYSQADLAEYVKFHVDAEREECARIAELKADNHEMFEVARLIRQRGEGPGPATYWKRTTSIGRS